MTTKAERAAAFELPGEIREAVLQMAEAHDIPLAWLLDLYRRGFNAKVGPTGMRPYGQSGPEDEGELTMAMGLDRAHGLVRMEFGKPVGWLALPAGHARHLAALLVQAADALDRSTS